MVSALAECYIVTLPGDRGYSRPGTAAGPRVGRKRHREQKGRMTMQQASRARRSGGTAPPGRSRRHAIAAIALVLFVALPVAAWGQGSGQGISGQGTVAPSAVPETAKPAGANPASNLANSPASAAAAERT